MGGCYGKKKESNQQQQPEVEQAVPKETRKNLRAPRSGLPLNL
jgi:hypothetical protein